ncbi:DUF6093 family protein [Nocardioides sp. ChNu-99]|uniref:DUF6093 family protein n=1 Tax=Nocardioides sp. ChNu-99 TaxID=2839897 RepID=UPI002405CE22|nr:DUF6093 family protein [Nocardioides sp. ChNu-99]MDF9718116.1 hypothetical protein [Nocardioides sp. ChNu-99]
MLNFHEQLAAGLDQLRGYAEDRMTSRVRVRRPGPPGAPVPGQLERPTWTTPHPDLPFRLDGTASSDSGSQRVRIGEYVFEGATNIGHVPALTRDLRDDDLIEVYAGEWAGTVWRVVKAVGADQKTARRLPLVEAMRPKEW